jgi:DNA excision repair protein ERCC-2
MQFDLDKKRITVAIGDLSDFTVGPREQGAVKATLWRAQLGTQWHTRLRKEYEALNPNAEFEVPIDASIIEKSWTISLTGRIDQLLRTQTSVLIREIKTITDPVPQDESQLRSNYPSYLAQLAAYASLYHNSEKLDISVPITAELIFVEIATGITQSLRLLPEDYALFKAQLSKIAEFCSLQLENRERRKKLRFNSAFKSFRQGQETTLQEISDKIRSENKALVLKAPTGFGKTGILLEYALIQLKSGSCERVIYLTSKSTGQLQVIETLRRMTKLGITEDSSSSLATWHVRNKFEHCINDTFYCVKESCSYLSQNQEKWEKSGLSRFYLFRNQANDLETLRQAGSLAKICPYEITRTALAFQDVWVGDYNYIFSPTSDSLFGDQLGYSPEKTLLIIDEAHNLSSRVAQVYSHELKAETALNIRQGLDSIHAPLPLINAWDNWAFYLSQLNSCDELNSTIIEEITELLYNLTVTTESHGLDYTSLKSQDAEAIWNTLRVAEQLKTTCLPLLWWVNKPQELLITCLDPSEVISAKLRSFGSVLLASATPTPVDIFSKECGIELSALEAHTPWRKNAYDIAIDTRVDTRFSERKSFYEQTALTINRLIREKKPNRPVLVFFPSYQYAEEIMNELKLIQPNVKISIQTKRATLNDQLAWLDTSVITTDSIFLILGSSFAESIDSLGGVIDYAMVVSPALPEVNSVKRAQLALLNNLGKDEAFHRVYRVPGMQKINQALGRLVRSPGHKTRVILHCRRFLEPAFTSLLLLDTEQKKVIKTESDFEDWLKSANT